MNHEKELLRGLWIILGLIELSSEPYLKPKPCNPKSCQEGQEPKLGAESDSIL